MPKEEVAFGSLLSLPDGFFDPEKRAPIQVTFDQAKANEGDEDIYTRVRYKNSNIETGKDDFKKYLLAFRKACVNSFGWTFEENEYDASILETVGFSSSIKSATGKYGYFLSALEKVSDRYMPIDTSRESN